MKVFSIGKIVLGILFASMGLYLFLKDVDFNKLLFELGSISIFNLIICCCLAILTLFLRSLRLHVLLPDMKDTSKKDLFSNIAIGFMINNIFPARIGEAARALILWQKNRFPATICIGTILLERTIDMLVFLTFFIIPVIFLPQCSSLIFFALFACGIILFCIAGTFLYIRFQTVTIRFGLWLLKWLPEKHREKLVRIAKELASTLVWLNSAGRVITVISLSFLISLCYPVIIILIAGKSDFSFGMLEGMFIQAFAVLGSLIPLAPGYIGTLHAVMLQGLSILGVESDKARALTIVYHAVNYIPITILGLYFFFRMNLSFEDIYTGKKRMQE